MSCSERSDSVSERGRGVRGGFGRGVGHDGLVRKHRWLLGTVAAVLLVGCSDTERPGSEPARAERVETAELREEGFLFGDGPGAVAWVSGGVHALNARWLGGKFQAIAPDGSVVEDSGAPVAVRQTDEGDWLLLPAPAHRFRDRVAFAIADRFVVAGWVCVAADCTELKAMATYLDPASDDWVDLEFPEEVPTTACSGIALVALGEGRAVVATDDGLVVFGPGLGDVSYSPAPTRSDGGGSVLGGVCGTGGSLIAGTTSYQLDGGQLPVFDAEAPQVAKLDPELSWRTGASPPTGTPGSLVRTCVDDGFASLSATGEAFYDAAADEWTVTTAELPATLSDGRAILDSFAVGTRDGRSQFVIDQTTRAVLTRTGPGQWADSGIRGDALIAGGGTVWVVDSNTGEFADVLG